MKPKKQKAPRKKKTHLALYEDTWFKCLADRHAWEKPTGRRFSECSYFELAELKGSGVLGCGHLQGGDCKHLKVRQAAFHVYYMEQKRLQKIAASQK